MTRMEDDLDVFRHHPFGQRINYAITELDVEDRDIGLGLLIGEHGGGQIVEWSFDNIACFGDGIAQVVSDDQFIFGNEYS